MKRTGCTAWILHQLKHKTPKQPTLRAPSHVFAVNQHVTVLEVIQCPSMVCTFFLWNISDLCVCWAWIHHQEAAQWNLCCSLHPSGQSQEPCNSVDKEDLFSFLPCSGFLWFVKALDLIVSYVSEPRVTPRLDRTFLKEYFSALTACDRIQSVSPSSCGFSTRLLETQGMQPFVGWILGRMLHGRVVSACFVSCLMSNVFELTELLYTPSFCHLLPDALNAVSRRLRRPLI